jgi:NAD(P)-dependent dehydrogenase (short-subunit alcohol dehydrogenase family)
MSARVANAGIAQVKALLDLTEEDFNRMFAVNVNGVQNCYAEAAKQLIKQGNCTKDAPGKLIAVRRSDFRYPASRHLLMQGN